MNKTFDSDYYTQKYECNTIRNLFLCVETATQTRGLNDVNRIHICKYYKGIVI